MNERDKYEADYIESFLICDKIVVLMEVLLCKKYLNPVMR